MYRAFQHFDTDNSGTISQSELREALRVRDSLIFIIFLRRSIGCMIPETAWRCVCCCALCRN